MKLLSLQPDPHMRWIYDASHPRYNSDEAKSLRQRRENAFERCPKWAIEEAAFNDHMKEAKSHDQP